MKDLFLLLHCVPECMYVRRVHARVCGGQKKALDAWSWSCVPLSVVSHQMRVLGIKSGFCARAASALSR